MRARVLRRTTLLELVYLRARAPFTFRFSQSRSEFVGRWGQLHDGKQLYCKTRVHGGVSVSPVPRVTQSLGTALLKSRHCAQSI